MSCEWDLTNKFSIDGLLCAWHGSDPGNTTMSKTRCLCSKSIKVNGNTDTYIGITIQWGMVGSYYGSTKDGGKGFPEEIIS